MVTSPLTDIRFPAEEDWGRVVAATTNIGAGAAGEKTITIPNEYPPIDRSIPHPVLAILAFQTSATLVASGVENCEISGQVDTGDAADSTGEFRITGDREIKAYLTANKTLDILIVYIAKGTGAKR